MSEFSLAGLDLPLDETLFGSKAARLSAALRAGLPVPPGFALSYQAVARLGREGLSGAEERRLQEAITLYGETGLAVRSSAIGEDSGSASFAGQHLSLLNVHGPAAFLRAVRAVWQSGQTPAALAYRARMNLPGEAQVAVLAQRLVASEISGVLFTVDPLDPSSPNWVVEASWGLGEAVVGGLVTPDHYVTNRQGDWLNCQPGHKDLKVVADGANGTAEVDITDPADYARPCLSLADLRGLTQLAAACEELFGPGQDIEWAISEGKVYLLQARPVTRRK